MHARKYTTNTTTLFTLTPAQDLVDEWLALLFARQALVQDRHSQLTPEGSFSGLSDPPAPASPSKLESLQKEYPITAATLRVTAKAAKIAAIYTAIGTKKLAVATAKGVQYQYVLPMTCS